MFSALVMLCVTLVAGTATDNNEFLTSVAMLAFPFPFILRSPQNMAFIISTRKKISNNFSSENLNLREVLIELHIFSFHFTS